MSSSTWSTYNSQFAVFLATHSRSKGDEANSATPIWQTKEASDFPDHVVRGQPGSGQSPDVPGIPASTLPRHQIHAQLIPKYHSMLSELIVVQDYVYLKIPRELCLKNENFSCCTGPQRWDSSSKALGSTVMSYSLLFLFCLDFEYSGTFWYLSLFRFLTTKKFTYFSF